MSSHPPIKLVLFDLDTLLDSASLSYTNNQADLQAAIAEEKGKPYKEVKETLVELQKGVALGYVTSSPEWYATTLLENYFAGIKWSRVVSYGADEFTGEAGQGVGLELALQGLEVPTKHILYIGDSAEDVEAGLKAGVKVGLALWKHKLSGGPWPQCGFEVPKAFRQDALNAMERGPDYVIDVPRGIFCVFPHHLSGLPLLEGVALSDHAVMPKPHLLYFAKEDFKSRDTVFGVALGRYFPSAHPRQDHELNRRLLAAKTAGYEPSWIRAIAFYLKALMHNGSYLESVIGDSARLEYLSRDCLDTETAMNLRTNIKQRTESQMCRFDLITVIPAKVGGVPRLENLASAVVNMLEFPWVAFDPNQFIWSSAAQSNMKLKFKERRDNVTHMQAHPHAKDVRGKRILVIDDIVTTGATLLRAKQILQQRAAKEVFALTLAMTCGSDLKSKATKLCPECGGELRLRTNNRDKSQFWGCQNYGIAGVQCTYTESYTQQDVHD